MKSKIRSQLCEIETDENVRIVYACESGSRAWGSPIVYLIETLSRFIADELDRWEKNSVINQQQPSNTGTLDELFRATLAKAWDIEKSSLRGSENRP